MVRHAQLGAAGLLEPPRASLTHPPAAITAKQKARRGFPHRKPGHPASARIKMPTPGKPEIGAHFVSFNFANTLISALMSRAACGAQ
jgi:hypothetical protein